MRRLGLITAALCLLATSLAAEEAPKRLIDRWSGIVFFCRADGAQDWTRDACRRITADVVAQSAAVGVKVAVLEATTEPQWMAKAEAAGFDGGSALSLAYVFASGAGSGGSTTLTLTLQEPIAPRPGVEPPGFAHMAQQTTTLDPGDRSDAAVTAAAAVWSALLGYLARPAS